MIDKISSWASGLIVAVIIGTIIEMLLPDNKNKKYVKLVIGLFIMYTIIAPVIGELDNINIDFDTIFTEYFEYTETQAVATSTDITLEQTYKQNIETDIESKLKGMGYMVNKIDTEINFEEENYGTINSISLKLKTDISFENNIVNDVEKIEISIGTENQNSKYTENNDKSDKIKKFLNDNYGIKIENIYIQFV